MYNETGICERIKELRTCNSVKLSMEKFGERLGVGKTAIHKLENGVNNVTDQMLKSICREFNVSEDWLRYGTGDMFVIPEDKTAAVVASILTKKDDPLYKMMVSFAETYEQLSPESQKVLQEFGAKWLENEKKNRQA